MAREWLSTSERDSRRESEEKDTRSVEERGWKAKDGMRTEAAATSYLAPWDKASYIQN